MPKTTAESLHTGTFRVTMPLSLDLPRIHGNDYSTINHGTKVLWNFWEKEQAILGRITGTEQNPWYVAYPGVQYVNNHSNSSHMVIAPRRERFVAPMDLTIDDAAQAAAFALKFLETSKTQAYAGYNIGPEKDGSQMWWNWHIHLVRFGEGELEDITTRPRIIWEPWPSYVEDVMDDIFVRRLSGKDGMPKSDKTKLSDLERFGFSSFGSSLFHFPSDLSPHELATVMQQVDITYKTVHKELKEIFFEQEEIDAPFAKRASEEVRIKAKEYADIHELRDQTTQSLVRFAEALPETLPDTPSKNSPLTLPNYSVVILRNQQGTYVLFQPHIFRKKASALSSLGIFLDYKLDTDPQRIKDYEEKKSRNIQLVNQINDSLHSDEVMA
jgi:hypothetical protein